MKKQTIKLNESKLRNIIKENIKKVLNEDYSRAFDLIEELKNCGLSSDDILRDLIGRIGGYAAVKYLLDIKNVEIGPYCDDDEDDALNESEGFAPHGYMTTSNLGGKEIEISNSNDAVRFRTEDGSISDWFEIDYDEEGNPIVSTPWGTEDLNNYMRFN